MTTVPIPQMLVYTVVRAENDTGDACDTDDWKRVRTVYQPPNDTSNRPVK